MAQATPQQKQVYDTLVIQALKFLFQADNAERFVQQAQSDPVMAMVNTTTLVLKQMKQAATMAGRDYVGGLTFIVPAGKEIIGHLTELLVAFGVIPKDQAQAMLQQAQQAFVEAVTDQGGARQPAGNPQAQPGMPPQQPTGGLLAQGA